MRWKGLSSITNMSECRRMGASRYWSPTSRQHLLSIEMFDVLSFAQSAMSARPSLPPTSTCVLYALPSALLTSDLLLHPSHSCLRHVDGVGCTCECESSLEVACPVFREVNLRWVMWNRAGTRMRCEWRLPPEDGIKIFVALLAVDRKILKVTSLYTHLDLLSIVQSSLLTLHGIGKEKISTQHERRSYLEKGA